MQQATKLSETMPSTLLRTVKATADDAQWNDGIAEYGATETAREYMLNYEALVGRSFVPAAQVVVTERPSTTYRAYSDGSPVRVREWTRPDPVRESGPVLVFKLNEDGSKGELLNELPPAKVSRRGRNGEGKPRKYADNAAKMRAYRARRKAQAVKVTETKTKLPNINVHEG